MMISSALPANRRMVNQMDREIDKIIQRMKDTAPGETICLTHDEVHAVLGQQEKVRPILRREGRNKYYNDYVCQVCDNEIVYEQNFCSECGREITWEDGEQG